MKQLFLKDPEIYMWFRTTNIFIGQHNKTSERRQYIFNIEEAEYLILKIQYVEFVAGGYFHS